MFPHALLIRAARQVAAVPVGRGRSLGPLQRRQQRPRSPPVAAVRGPPPPSCATGRSRVRGDDVPPPHGRCRASLRSRRSPPAAPLSTSSSLWPHVRDGRADNISLVSRRRLPALRGFVRSHEMPMLLVQSLSTSRQCASPPVSTRRIVALSVASGHPPRAMHTCVNTTIPSHGPSPWGYVAPSSGRPPKCTRMSHRRERRWYQDVSCLYRCIVSLIIIFYRTVCP